MGACCSDSGRDLHRDRVELDGPCEEAMEARPGPSPSGSSANSSCIRLRSKRQKPVSSSSASPPTPGPHTTTGDASIARATARGSADAPVAPPVAPFAHTPRGLMCGEMSWATHRAVLICGLYITYASRKGFTTNLKAVGSRGPRRLVGKEQSEQTQHCQRLSKHKKAYATPHSTSPRSVPFFVVAHA